MKKKQNNKKTICINDYEKDGFTQMGRACRDGNIQKVKKLLKNYPEIDLSKGYWNGSEDFFEISALDLAKNNHKIISILFQSDPKLLKSSNFTHINIIMDEERLRNGCEDIVDQVDQAFNMMFDRDKCVAPALRTSIKNHNDINKVLLIQEYKTALGTTVGDKNELCIAITANNLTAVKAFLQTTPELLDMPNSQQQTSLHYAASHGNDEILKILLEQNKNLHILDKFGYTPLDYAAKEGHVSTAALLIKHGLVDSKYRSNYQKAYTINNKEKMHALEKYAHIIDQAQQLVSFEENEPENVAQQTHNDSDNIHEVYDNDIVSSLLGMPPFMDACQII